MLRPEAMEKDVLRGVMASDESHGDGGGGGGGRSDDDVGEREGEGEDIPALEMLLVQQDVKGDDHMVVVVVGRWRGIGAVMMIYTAVYIYIYCSGMVKKRKKRDRSGRHDR